MTHSEFKYYLRDNGYAATLYDADEMLNGMIRALKELLVEGEPVVWKGFGTFGVSDFKGHTIKGVNGKDIDLPTCKTIRFKASEILKREVREGFLRD